VWQVVIVLDNLDQLASVKTRGARAALAFIPHQLPHNVRLIVGVGAPVTSFAPTAPSMSSGKAAANTSTVAPPGTPATAAAMHRQVAARVRSAMRASTPGPPAVSHDNRQRDGSAEIDNGPYDVFDNVARRASVALVRACAVLSRASLIAV
jgi:hypothetical protein